VRKREPQSHGRAAIENVEPISAQAEIFSKRANSPGEILKGVGELSAGGRIRKSKAGKIRRHDAVSVSEPGDQLAKHVRRSGESVEQQNRGRVRLAGFTVENVAIVDFDLAVAAD
jgi:hypothetical protein